MNCRTYTLPTYAIIPLAFSQGVSSCKLCLNVSEMELLNCCKHVLDGSLGKLLLQLSMTTSTFQLSFFKIFFWESFFSYEFKLFELNYFLNTNWIMPNVLKVMIKNVFTVNVFKSFLNFYQIHLDFNDNYICNNKFYTQKNFSMIWKT